MQNEAADNSCLNDAQRLKVLNDTALMDSPPEQAFDRLTRIAAQSLNVPVSLVSLVDDTRQFFKSQYGLPEPVATIRQTPLSHSFCQHVVTSRAPLVVKDSRQDPRLQGNPVIAALGVIAYAGFPLITSDGEVLGSFCAIDRETRDWSAADLRLLEDLAAVVMSEIKLKRAKENAETANKAKDRFLAMLSHELRTPLSPVLLISAAMAGDPTLPASVREDARIIQRNVQQQTRLVDDLLDLTRIENGKVSLQMGSVDLHDLIEDVVKQSAADAFARGVALNADLKASRYHIRGDSSRLRQIFSNLLRNAIKFTPSEGKVCISTGNSLKNKIEVRVTDTGIGIDPGVLPKVFNAFEQGSRSITDEFSGLGLGLAITRGLVDAHEGTIHASSEGKNRGCQMTVTLPTVEVAVPTPAPPPVVAALGRQVSILLVEDHRDTLRAMSRLLRNMQHRVTPVDSVSAALAAAEGEKFDLLISDLDLPDGSGLDLMRQVSNRQTIRGIALTGYGMEEDLQKTHDAGFELHLVKPINFKDLEAAIQQTFSD